MNEPVHVANAGDGSGRLFIVERAGRIRLVKNGLLQGTPFLDISSKTSVGGERGLLSVAFPPGYANTGRFYVFYTQAVGGDLVIARYHVTANPDVADPLSEEILLIIEHSSASNHNGGQLAFSPTDGYLYISTGDGGSTPSEAQNMSSLLGKVLRIDTESGVVPYGIPPDNPFLQTAGARPEIWARGLRNPWRFAFDRANGDLYLADVGQSSWEEVDVQRDASPGGENYGWNLMEGLHCYQVANCNQAGLTLPVLEYSSAGSDCAIMGGVVYRGTLYPRMQGVYFYGDYCTGKIWGLQYNGTAWQSSLLATFSGFAALTSFGEGEDGSIYFADSTGGAIYQITDPGPTADAGVTLAGSSSVAVVGQPFTLTATVTNGGPDVANGVVLSEALAAGPTIGTVTPSQGTCSLVGRDLTCTLGTIGISAGATVSVFLTPGAVGSLTNTANVSATEVDPNTVNNSASLTTNVISEWADLAVTQSDVPDPVTVGGSVTYNITVTNLGPSATTGVTLTDTLPIGVTFDSATPSQGSCGAPSGGAFTCALGSLANGANATVNVVVTTSAAGVIANTASVSSVVVDLVLANNEATTATNVGDVSRLLAIATRSPVLTAPNLVYGGFIISGGSAKTVLIRGRGPSMAGAPFFVPATLANPQIQVYAGQTIIAQNNNWQTTDPLCLSPATACGSTADILATGADPCQPNPGQSVAPPGCAQEAAVLITLPPGGYTVVMSGVGNTSGTGLIEVFEPDTTVTKVVAIATRGTVQAAPNLMHGGFIIGAGSTPKTVLIRGRGPSMGGAPFFVPSTLANPMIQVYSGQTVIAQNDDWQTTDSSCLGPAIACGNVDDILATGADPCQPNPGQSVAPPGCSQEAAVVVTLPPGGYTVVMSGVGNSAGAALIEVFEVQ